MKISNSLKITALGLVGFLVLYWPVNALLQIARASSNEKNTTQAQIYQLTQNKQEILPLPQELTDFDSGLSPNAYTSENYVQPKYDPFNNKFRPYHDFEDKIEVTDRAANTAPRAKFSVRTVQKGIADTNSGTTETDFIFNASSSHDNETEDHKLKVRWDFESDGEIDGYFSQSKTIKHKYENPGVYTVTLEVMDGGGLISTAKKDITVVENTKPFAHFTYTPGIETSEKIFTFNSKESYDSQYKDTYLEYRFDWDGDGIWDTPYKTKNIWRHKFENPGQHYVRMEAKDPEGAVDTTYAVITTTENVAPVARFTVDVKTVKAAQNQYRDRYYFDASASTDLENPKLKYRWDFNYTGKNDIQFDTSWVLSPKHNGYYDFSGEKTVRLQVMDEDGAVAEAFVTFEV